MSDDLTRLRELRAKANGVITAMTSLVNELDAMLAAEPEPDPAPDDAFAGAVSRFGVLAEDVGTVRTSIWSRLPESEKGREAPPELVAAIEEREAARQRILALHRQAKHAGLVEIKRKAIRIAEEFDPFGAETQEKDRVTAVVVRIALGTLVSDIDAMLTGKE